MYENNLRGNSIVLTGPANSGKESHIMWLCKGLNQQR
jgi:hypothetical protein